MSQAQLGKAFNKGHKTIGNWETGYSEPGLDDLILISNFFSVDLDRLVKQEINETNTQPTNIGNRNQKSSNPNETIPDDVSDIKLSLQREINEGSLTVDDEIAWRDQYILVLENKLCEAATASVSQQTFQNLVSQLLTLQEMVMELTNAQEDTDERLMEKANTRVSR